MPKTSVLLAALALTVLAASGPIAGQEPPPPPWSPGYADRFLQTA